MASDVAQLETTPISGLIELKVDGPHPVGPLGPQAVAFGIAQPGTPRLARRREQASATASIATPLFTRRDLQTGAASVAIA